MKNFSTTVVFILALCFSGIAQESEIWDRLDNAFDALHKHDAEAFAANFTSDATLIAPFGLIMRSKEDIRKTHAKIFEQWGNPPEQIVEQQSNKKIEYLNEDLALVSFVNMTKGDRTRGVGKVSYSVLMKEVGDDWLVRSVQMTPVQDKQKQ